MADMGDWVWMSHPDTDGAQRFAGGAAEGWRELGWRLCDPPPEPNLAIGAEHPSRPAPVSTPARSKTRRVPAETGTE